MKGLYLPSSCLRLLRGTEEKFPTPYSGDASEVYISVQFTQDTARISRRNIKIKEDSIIYFLFAPSGPENVFNINF